MIAVRFHQFAARGHAVELFEQQATLSAAAQAQFANQLLVAGALAGRTFDTAEEFAVGHSRDMLCESERPKDHVFVDTNGSAAP